jgi:outer membrane receptor protein involved in Fe transport
MSIARRRKGAATLATLASVLLLGLPAIAGAQVTTGSIAGSVVAESDASPLPGVAVAAMHLPTGTTYNVFTSAAGRFLIANVRVGGPYTVTAVLDGFASRDATEVEVDLGNTTEVEIALPLATVEETIEVVGSGVELINPTRTGSGSQVSLQEIEALPTVGRSLQDFARTNPYFAVDAQDASSTRFYVAGKNNRYNTILIDGAVNNDLFGLADSGTPGGQADAPPISLDAIEQVQMLVSPYDVRLSGFTGGGINAVTRSGSNDWHGSIYGASRDEDSVGKGPFDEKVATFSEEQIGFRLGGPLLKDRLFFFVSGEINRLESPDSVSADGSTARQFFKPADAAAVKNILSTRYGYDPGSLGEMLGTRDNDLLFARLDWNAGAHQVTLRHNYVEGTRDVLGDRNTREFRFETSTYSFATETNSTVLQVNSVFGSSFNEVRLGIQTIRDARAVPVIFPSIEVGGSGPRNADVYAGTERFSGANGLDQDIFEFTDDFTFLKGDHTITIGTNNEVMEFSNLFYSDFYGYYYFPTVADLDAGFAEEYSISFATGPDPRATATPKLARYGFYVGDQWRVNDHLSLNLGLRLDKADYKKSPSFNPLTESAIGYDSSKTGDDGIIVSPRIGFNWDIDGSGVQQLRGGVGIFAGRSPHVWISNVYVNTGIEGQSLSFDEEPIPFNPDPLNQPHLGGAGSLRVDLMDPNFEYPRVLRSTLAYDRKLPGGIEGTAELIWTLTEKDILVQNVNKERSGVSPLDGRPFYRSVSSSLRDALLLTNTSKGEQLIATVMLRKMFDNGLTLTGSYAFMDSESAFDGTSSRAISNWQFAHTPGEIFDYPTSTSAFEVRDRFNFSANFTFDTGRVTHSVGAFYTAQTGRPYSVMMGGDPNGDGYTTNDLLYVPASADEIILKDVDRNVIPYSRLADFLRAANIDPFAGRILSRYESNEPWLHQLDLRYAIEVPFSRLRGQVVFDLLNALNLIDGDVGVVEYVSNQNFTPVRYDGIDAATGKPIYRENSTGSLDPGEQFRTENIRSRWQARLGLRLSF